MLRGSRPHRRSDRAIFNAYILTSFLFVCLEYKDLKRKSYRKTKFKFSENFHHAFGFNLFNRSSYVLREISIPSYPDLVFSNLPTNYIYIIYIIYILVHKQQLKQTEHDGNYEKKGFLIPMLVPFGTNFSYLIDALNESCMPTFDGDRSLIPSYLQL